jgi:hypothetical protein
MRSALHAPGVGAGQRLVTAYGMFLSSFAFNVNLRPYTSARRTSAGSCISLSATSAYLPLPPMTRTILQLCLSPHGGRHGLTLAPFQIWLEGEGAKCGKCVRTGTRAKACCPLMHTEAYPSLYIGKCVWVHWYSAINLLGSE